VAQDDQRVRRIKQYVLARLREELALAPRGAQARLAKRLGVSGAHLSNMLSTTPTRQPGEDFRRKVAAHWGVTYAQLEALALGEEVPVSKPALGSGDNPFPANLFRAAAEHNWMAELPSELRNIVREQARMHYVFTHEDLTRAEWQRVLAGLEREALAFLASRQQTTPPPATASSRPATKKRARNT
jgi:transcriptional regulator with XRE-family HTH domain